MGMEGRGPCEVRRGICVRPIVPRLSSGVPKTPSLPMCNTQKNTAQFPQSVWDKGDVLQSPPICWYCLPDVLIPTDKLGNTFIPIRHVCHDSKVGLSAHSVSVIRPLMQRSKKLQVLPRCLIQKASEMIPNLICCLKNEIRIDYEPVLASVFLVWVYAFVFVFECLRWVKIVKYVIFVTDNWCGMTKGSTMT